MGREKKNYQDPVSTFKRLYGVLPDTFNKMKDILQKEYNQLHKRGGKPPDLSVEDKLFITLEYLREYRTMEHIGNDWGVCKSTVCESIQWVENTLKKDGTFKLPGKKVLKKAPLITDFIVIDVTESPINRPKKTKKSTIQAKRSVIQ